MTFSGKVKEEICNAELSRLKIISLLAAFIRATNSFVGHNIEIFTENKNTATFLKNKLEEVYSLNTYIDDKNGYKVVIKDALDILIELSVLDSDGSYLTMPKEYLVSDESLVSSYFLGTFLGRGSVSDPKTSNYHLEILLDKKGDAIFLQRILNKFDMNARVHKRANKYMIYIKEADKISDFLKMIKAYNSVLYYENIRVYKEEMNNINRLNNMEQANVERAMNASNKMIKKINKIKEHIHLLDIDDKMRETMEYRIKYPESSLNELSEKMSKETGIQITKSGLNHRFRKINDEYTRLNVKLRKQNKNK